MFIPAKYDLALMVIGRHAGPGRLFSEEEALRAFWRAALVFLECEKEEEEP